MVNHCNSRRGSAISIAIDNVPLLPQRADSLQINPERVLQRQDILSFEPSLTSMEIP